MPAAASRRAGRRRRARASGASPSQGDDPADDESGNRGSDDQLLRRCSRTWRRQSVSSPTLVRSASTEWPSSSRCSSMSRRISRRGAAGRAGRGGRQACAVWLGVVSLSAVRPLSSVARVRFASSIAWSGAGGAPCWTPVGDKPATARDQQEHRRLDEEAGPGVASKTRSLSSQAIPSMIRIRARKAKTPATMRRPSRGSASSTFSVTSAFASSISSRTRVEVRAADVEDELADRLVWAFGGAVVVSGAARVHGAHSGGSSSNSAPPDDRRRRGAATMLASAPVAASKPLQTSLLTMSLSTYPYLPARRLGSKPPRHAVAVGIAGPALEERR